MAIDFTKKGAAQQAAGTNKADLPKSKFWLNIGFVAEGANEDSSDAFVSLPYGIPLDSMEPVKTASKNADFHAFQCARNDLLSQLQEYAKTLQPGEEVIIELQVQLRHVNEEVADVPATENRFARKLQLKS